jgi:hypothetical protein
VIGSASGLTPLLYIWFSGDPHSGEPDAAIEDTPGVSDLVLVAHAAAEGRLGRYLPPKLAISPHREPGPTGFRAIDVSRLLREYQIPHRRRYEILQGDEAGEDHGAQP